MRTPLDHQVRPQRRRAGPRTTWSAAILTLTLALTPVLTGCTDTPGPGPSGSATAGDFAAPTPSPTSTPSPSPDPEADVRAVWTQAHTLRLEATYGDAEPVAATFAEVADPDTAEALAALAAAGRPEVATVHLDTGSDPAISVEVAAAEIRDCVLEVVRVGDDASSPTLRTTLWEGNAVRTPAGWRVTAVRLGTEACVPAALAGSAVAAHRAWIDAANDWWDPPAPDDRRIGELMAEPAVTTMRDLLREHEQLGIAVRDRHDPSAAVVTDVRGDVVTVSDCYDAARGGAAAYDLSTGERRTDLTPLPRADQRDALVVELRADGAGGWMVVGWSARVDVACEPGETAYVLVP